MPTIHSHKKFEPKSSHTYLLDNSVLLYAYAPIGNYGKVLQTDITNFLTNAKTVAASIAITSLVLSEFYNVVFKDSFQEWKEDKNNAEIQKGLNKTQVLKQLYRPSKQFKIDVDTINASIKQILKLSDLYNDEFNNIDIANILSGCDHLDYNDSYFIELANRKQWHICTRDNDIIKSTKLNCDIISFL
jgi:predicted nucleic acid-binding protein